ncbi:MAG TPA: DNA-binding response regulator [Lachnospiraceae bacterium]|jgi:Response regulators consisting of a CheY-like receiver domain and a winged-helix DNA-binding domain|nr:DNA-binding response regulator [Lachnospiraceae bacterium]
MFNILVCDDDKSIVDAIEIYLVQEKYNVIKAYDGYEALKILQENEVHLILMDVMMPRMDGLKATIKIRETQNIPIIILSAKSEDTDKILGLNFGADDYLSKPFNPLELMARIKSQMRRYTFLGSIAEKSNTIKIGDLELDKDAKEVMVANEQVKLTATEYGILLLLMENAGKVFSIDEIYEKVWNELSFAPENTVSVHIRRIREKIEINPKEPKYLKVVWGIGYKIEKI